MPERTLRINIVGNARQLQATFGEVEGRLGRFAAGIGRVGLAAGAALGGVVAAAGGVAVAAGTMGVKTAAGLEQAEIAFTTLLKSGAKAEAFLGDLKKFAASTPFELPGLISAARQLIGVGASAKSVIPTLKAWGDAAGALGLSQEQFERAMLAVTQAMSKGKVQAEELMQITEAGIPIWPLLAKALGKSVPELQKMASEGRLLSKDVFPALEQQMNRDYGGAMAKQSQTLTGLWSTLMDTINIGLADVIKPFEEELKGGLKRGIEIAGEALRTFAAWLTDKAIPAVREWVDEHGPQLRATVEKVAKVITEDVVPAVKSFWHWLSEELWPAVQEGVTLIGEKLQPKLEELNTTWDENTEGVQNLVNALKPITDRIFPFLAWAIPRLVDEIKPFIEFLGDLGAGWDGLRRIVTRVVKWITDEILGMVEQILAVLAFLVPGTNDPIQRMKNAFSEFRRHVNEEFEKKLRKDYNIDVTGHAQLTYSSGVIKSWVEARMRAGRMASGGMVIGPGGPREDLVPRWLSNGEFVVNAAATSRYRQLLEAINEDRIPRMAAGGLVVNARTSDAAMSRGLAGFGALTGAIAGLFKTGLTTALKDALKDLGGSRFIGGSVINYLINYIRSAVPDASVISTLRPGAVIAGTNRQSLHAIGRAVDFGGPLMDVWRRAVTIPHRKEVIYSAAPYQVYSSGIHPGPPASAITRRNHWSHVHVGLFDQGGVLEPGLNLMANRTGRREPLIPDRGGITVNVNLNGPILGSARQVARELAPEIRSGIREAQRRDGIPAHAQIR